MKRMLVPTAIFALLLTGCGGEGKAGEAVVSASETTVATTVQETTSAPVIMPQVAGLRYGDVINLIRASGNPVEVLGSDGKEVYGEIPDDAIVAKSNVAAGTAIEDDTTLILFLTHKGSELAAAAAAANEKEALVGRYEYSCSKSGDTYLDDPSIFPSFSEVWASKDFADLDTCSIRIDGNDPMDSASGITLLASEQKVVNKLHADGGDTSIGTWAFAEVLDACSLPPKEDWGRPENGGYKWEKATAVSAAAMCPNAPFVGTLKRIASGALPTDMKDGKYTVGKVIEAGTYQLQTGGGGASDCYWERTGPQGDIIDNGFINYAPQAPEVTINDGEGFVSERCGLWKKIG